MARTHIDPPSGASRRRNKPAKKYRTAADGQVTAKFFNVLAGRPYPSVSSLVQEIRVGMTYRLTPFFSNVVGTAWTPATQVFTLAMAPNQGEYTGLFDQYRIDQIECWIEPTAPQGTTSFPMFASAVDLDDANTPTEGGVEGKQCALTGDGGAGRYHRWKPHTAVAMYSGSFVSYGNVASAWIDVASPNVQHYGLKVTCGPSTSIVTYNMSVRYVVSFRGPGI